MKSDASAKQFDCVAYMREVREQISAKISSMSHEEQQFPLAGPMVVHGGLEPLWSKVA